VQILPWQANSRLRIGTEWAAVSNAPFRWFKQNTFRGGVNTPAIIHWPAGLRARGIDHTPAHIVDIAPTVLELAKVQYPQTHRDVRVGELVGQSLLPILQGESVVRTEPIYYNYASNLGLEIGNAKLLSYRGGPWELYNLGTDPFETENLAASYPEKVQEMAEEWMRIAKEVDQAPARDRQARGAQSTPWGITYIATRRDEVGDPNSHEQPPEFRGEPPLPLP
jgi:arylsulfatase